MSSKECEKCKTPKDISSFSKNKRKKDGLNQYCKPCQKDYMTVYYEKNKQNLNEKNKDNYKKNSEHYKALSKKHREDNKEYHKEYHKMYYSENKENLLEYKKDHYQDNKSKYLERAKNWRENNHNEFCEYLKDWKEENPEYAKEYWKNNRDKKHAYDKNARSKHPHIFAWRQCLRSVIQRLGGTKESSTIELLGYSAEDLKNHMSKLFKEGMSWENWGEWHVDHIIPVSKFDTNAPMSVVNSLDNLQPLWAFDNLSKNNNIS